VTVIDDDVPLPPRKGRGFDASATTYPFAKMRVGQSAFFPGVSGSAKFAAAEYARQHPEVRFETRSFDCDPKTKLPGTRVWRTK
jgi:hypothetical protein